MSTERGGEEKGEAAKVPLSSTPSWRSVQIGPALAARETSSSPRLARAAAVPSSPKPLNSVNDVIDKAAFFGNALDDEALEASMNLEESELEAQSASSSGSGGNWVPTKLRPVPAFYPLEKSSRFIDDDLPKVASRISECLRLLSVQAFYNNDTATANLLTAENVEMHLSLWRTNGGPYPDGIVVELQRRKGCSITFHRYSRYILDSAIGDFDFEADAAAYQDIDRSYSRKVQRLLSREMGSNNNNNSSTASEEENAVIAIEIAHGLIMKDRMDARQLGLESLCLLTDPRKTGTTTALLTSRVVLLGTSQDGSKQEEGIMFDEAPFQEIREAVLSLVQLGRIGDEEEFGDDDDDKRQEPDFEDDDDGDGNDADDMEGRHPEEKEHLRILHNLALAVLANALDVIENYDTYDTDPEQTAKKPRAVGDESSKKIANAFMSEATDITRREILGTLIRELEKAERTPHNARLSAKCLRSLLSASDEARRRARELGAKNVVHTALDVGVRTHAKLETECKSVLKVLTETGNDDEEQQDQEHEE